MLRERLPDKSFPHIHLSFAYELLDCEFSAQRIVFLYCVNRSGIGECFLSLRLPEALLAVGRYRPATVTEIVETPLSFSSSDHLLPLCLAEDE